MSSEPSSQSTLPTKAQVVVIGGGVVGCSVLYHLAERGIDAILIEKNDLTNGATWHAVGLVGKIRSSQNATRLIRYSAELYRNLEKITGQSAGWTEVGSLKIASSEDRMMELRKIATQGKSFGMEVELLTPEQCPTHVHRDLRRRPLVPHRRLRGSLHAHPVPRPGSPPELRGNFPRQSRRRI